MLFSHAVKNANLILKKKLSSNLFQTKTKNLLHPTCPIGSNLIPIIRYTN